MQGHGLSYQVCTLCIASCLPRRSKNMTSISFVVQCIIKQLLHLVFVISRNNQGLGEVYQPQPLAYYSGYHKNLIQ